MHLNEHYVEFLVRERLADARADRARLASIPRRRRRALRMRLGGALIALGRRLAEVEGGGSVPLSGSVAR